MIGRKVGRYEIVAKLGQGGMGTVWKARDPLLERDIALKFLPENLAGSKAARRRFLREAKAASDLNHPGIATVFDAGEDQGQLYIAIQLVPGQTVGALVRTGPLDVSDALRIALAAARALAHAHEHRILHRDVTSNNIMVGGDGTVTIIDFGLALVEDHTRLTISRATMGTAGFMAPEMVLGQEASGRTDVYSLGIVLYDMLTGVMPFQSDKLDEQLRATVHDRAPPPSTLRSIIPVRLDRLVQDMLAKDPAARPNGEQLVSRLEALLAGTPEDEVGLITTELTAPLPVLTSDDGASEAKSAKHRSRGVLLVILFLLLAAIGWITRSTMLKRTEPEPLSVSVLPFELGQNPEESRWLREVIGRDLTARLNRLSTLRVVPWSASRTFENLNQWENVASQLNVDALIGGSCDVAGRTVRGSAYMIDPASTFQTWAYTLGDHIDDIFASLDTMAVDIAVELLGDLRPGDRESLMRDPTSSVDALRWYGQGLLAASGAEALRWFERAIQRDATFVDAMAAMGRVHLQTYQALDDLQALARAESTFARAARLDSTSAEVQHGLTHVVQMRKAIESGP